MINLRNEKSYKKSNSIFTIDLNKLHSLDNFFLKRKIYKGMRISNINMLPSDPSGSLDESFYSNIFRGVFL